MADRNVELARGASRRQCVALSLPSVNSSTATSNWHGGEPNGPGSCRDHALRFVSGSEVIRGGRFELVEVVGAGDNVVVIMRPPAHGAGPAAPVASLATCRDDRVIEIVHCPDAREALAAAAARRTAHGCRQTAGCLPPCPGRPWLTPRAVLLLGAGSDSPG